MYEARNKVSLKNMYFHLFDGIEIVMNYFITSREHLY